MNELLKSSRYNGLLEGFFARPMPSNSSRYWFFVGSNDIIPMEEMQTTLLCRFHEPSNEQVKIVPKKGSVTIFEEKAVIPYDYVGCVLFKNCHTNSLFKSVHARPITLELFKNITAALGVVEAAADTRPHSSRRKEPSQEEALVYPPPPPPPSPQAWQPAPSIPPYWMWTQPPWTHPILPRAPSHYMHNSFY